MKAESATIVQIDEKELIVHFEDGRLLSMSAEFAPEGVRAGDCCCIVILPDINQVAAAQVTALRMIENLTSGRLTKQSKQEGYASIIHRVLKAITRENTDGYRLVNLATASQEIAAALVGGQKK